MGIVLWIVVLVTANQATGATETLIGLATIVAWAIMPVSVYFDAQYVRANSRWNPNTTLYVIGMLIWIVNIAIGVVYLYRRNKTLGEP